MRRSILFAGLMTVLLAGCAKEVEPQDRTDGNYPVLTLTARLTETKTALGAAESGKLPVLWNADDQIWVRSAAQEAGTAGNLFVTSAENISADGKEARFSGEAPSDGPYVAAYPYSAVASGSDNTRLLLDIPAVQNYAAGTFAPGANPSVAVWESGTSMSFTNIFGLLRLKLTGSAPLQKIVVTDNAGDALWGSCQVAIDATSCTAGEAEITNSAENRSSLTLDCGEGVTLGPEPTVFYFVAPAGAFAKGFTCTLYDVKGTVLKTIVTNTPCTIQRNGVSSLESINPESTPFSGGKGTSADPYRITTPADLVQMSSLVNGDDASFASASYKQLNDIDMEGTAVNCIGLSSGKPFKGNYDGGSYTIKNLSPAKSSSASGMFGYTDGATIQNLTVDGYTNNGTNGEQGVIAGRAKNTTFRGINVNGTVDFVKCACGGIVGYMEGGSIENCRVEGFIHNEDTDTFQGVTVVSCVGGIAGYIENASISGCSFSGNVTSKGEQLGGIVGQIKGGTVENCSVEEGSTVTGDNYYVGGIAGEMLGSGNRISDCTVDAHVICYYPGAAGIVAWVQSGDIDNCVVGPKALVRTGQDKAGGIVAYIYHKDTAQTVNISNCAVYCDVAASYSVGGIVGECNPTNNSSVVNIWNCAYQGGEIIDAGHAASKWTMVGGIVAWARMGSTTSTLNIVNCFSDPETIRCDFPWSNEVDMGGFIGEQGGANASVNIQGCYNTLAYGTAVINSMKDIPSNYYNYAALVGLPNTTNFNSVWYINSLPALGKANSGTSANCEGLPVGSMSDGTLLAKLNAFVDSYSGPLTLKKWVAGDNTYPVLAGMVPVSLQGKERPLRVSIIGDSLSTFDGYAPHGYQGSRAPNGYRCHYPSTDGNVTSAAQTYWYILTYELLSNAVWDTNLAFSGTATTRCTDSSYSDKYWYGQDFCTRYIENGGMGHPDIIIINGGANDWAHGIYNLLGSQKLVRYPSTTPHRPSDAAMNAAYAVADAAKTLDEAKALPDATFIEAYLKLVRMMTLQYPHVKIVVLIHDTLTPDVEESLLHIADHYDNCRAVDLYAVNGFNDLGWNFEYLDLGYQPNMPKHDFDWSAVDKSGDLRKNCSDHYSAVAMRFIANKIYDELGPWLESSASYNESDNGSIGNFDNINGQW